mmetsp:Transcript_31730/g.87644  ORF Transcript_31730/g.87644 Transcript_31730/m.87644 type:complete len:265 (+) Transcript_31730:608-1402(+)
MSSNTSLHACSSMSLMARTAGAGGKAVAIAGAARAVCTLSAAGVGATAASAADAPPGRRQGCAAALAESRLGAACPSDRRASRDGGLNAIGAGDAAEGGAGSCAGSAIIAQCMASLAPPAARTGGVATAGAATPKTRTECGGGGGGVSVLCDACRFFLAQLTLGAARAGDESMGADIWRMCPALGTNPPLVLPCRWFPRSAGGPGVPGASSRCRRDRARPWDASAVPLCGRSSPGASRRATPFRVWGPPLDTTTEAVVGGCAAV